MNRIRTLAVRARLTFPTGAAVELSGADILNFTVEEGADTALLPGNVLSAAITIELANDCGQWRYGGALRGERPLIGSTLELWMSMDGIEQPCGTFIIDGISAGEHTGRIRFSGSDSIAGELAFSVRDTLPYPATLAQVWQHLVAQTRYGWSGDVPNGDAVIDAAPDWKDASLRKAMGWAAQAMGCFVKADRSGALELVRCVGGGELDLEPDAYFSFSDGFESFGPVTGLRVTPMGAQEAVDVGDSATMLEIAENPLFAENAAHLQSLMRGTLAQLEGLTLNRMEFRWRGSPDVSIGTRVHLTDTFGAAVEGTVTRQSLRFDGGFDSICTCGVPTRSDVGMVRAITPEGGLNGGALTGTVDGGLLAAGSVVTEKLAADSVTAGKIAAGAISADKISAGAITAEKLAAHAVDTQSVRAITAAFENMTADEVQTDALYAAMAHVIQLAAGSIQAGRIDADRLAAALARIVSLQAQTGEFDFAAVKNLISGALVLEKGVLDSVLISNLAVTSANLLSATLGELILKGSDGQYYAVTVGSNGVLGATVVDAEGGAFVGKTVVETSANVGLLNAGNVMANQAVLGTILTEALSAGKITAGQALIASATIPALYVSAIDAIGGSIDLTANSAIRSIVGSAEMTNGSLDGLAQRMEQDTARLDVLERLGAGQENVLASLRSEVEQLADRIGLKVTKADLETWLRFTMLGLELGSSDSAYSTLIDDRGFHIRQYGEDIAAFAKRELLVPTLRVASSNRFGTALRAASDGGILI